MSAAIAVVAGRLAGQWTWSLFTALVGVVILVAGLEIVRGRAARAEARSQDGIDSPGPTSATDSVAALGTQSQAAGRDIRNVKIGTGGAVCLVGVFLVASVLSGGTVLFGRYELGPAAPPVPTSEVAASPVGASPASDTGQNPGGVDQTYQSDFILTVLIGGHDLDPPDDTLGLADVSYSPSSGALAYVMILAILAEGKLDEPRTDDSALSC